MIIYFGDLHIKEIEPHRTASIQFLNWLKDNYKDDTIICGGDLFNSSLINHNLVLEVITILKQFKDFRIFSGNHDMSSKKIGNILLPISSYDNITIYRKQKEIKIDDINFIILPNTYSENKEYENIKGEWDYSLNHFTPIQEAFGDEGIELKFNVKVSHIFSHIHRHNIYKDNYNNNILIAGSVINTRHGEQDWKKYIYKLEKDKYEKIEVPYFFTYKTIEYGEEIEKNNDIYNVINAPSIPSVLEKYKNNYIREEGIELILLNENEQKENNCIEKNSLKKDFVIFSIDNNIDDNLKNTCLQYIEN